MEQEEQEVRASVRSFLGGRSECWVTPKEELLLQVAKEDVIQECMTNRNHWVLAGKERGIKYVSAVSDCAVGKVNWLSPDYSESEVEVVDKTRWLYQEGMELNEEERKFAGTLKLKRDALSGKMQVVDLYWLGESTLERPEFLQEEEELEPILSTESWRIPYNRMRAFQYAELYWNRAAPNFRHFEVDCTNFVSQVIGAGGFPIDWSKSKSKGWWYRGTGGSGDTWSYSWAVAHSLKMYLSQKSGVQQVADPKLLEVGDVICYDWDGDGHWQHNTVVVGFDRRGNPLVNAHTVDSRHRYWAYHDSYAFTPKTEYSFFHITF